MSVWREKGDEDHSDLPKLPKAGVSLEQPCRGPRKPANSPQKPSGQLTGISDENSELFLE